MLTTWLYWPGHVTVGPMPTGDDLKVTFGTADAHVALCDQAGQLRLVLTDALAQLYAIEAQGGGQ
jgi:hypothetical protein